MGEGICVKNVPVLKDETERALQSYKVWGEECNDRRRTESSGTGRQYFSFQRFLMSVEARRQQSSVFLALLLKRSMKKHGYLRTLMTSSTLAVKVTFARTSRETAGEVSSSSARLWCTVDGVGRKRDVAAK